MYNGGGSRPHWQNANNPNMAPLPIRPRPGLGVGPPPGMQAGMGQGGPPPQPPPGMMMMTGGPPPMPGMMGRPPPMMGPPPTMGGMPVGPTPSSAGGVPAHTTLFVGNISAGVTDAWLQSLLDSCGPLRSLKRVNASFGFAEFADPDSVLRALAVLSGLELPALGVENQDKPNARKKLTVKADEKTRKFLDQYESEKEKTEDDDRIESRARQSVDTVLAQMSDPANIESTQVATSYNVPSHLKDLPPEELPEEHRGSVLSEIDKFRQASAAREEEKKRRDRVQELERKRTNRDAPRGAPSGPSAANGDRQSYLRPVSFVASEAGADEKNLRADERDERDEERRKQREKEDLLRFSQEAERKYLDQERIRLSHWDRELSKERATLENREREAIATKKLYETWEQSRKMDSNIFYVERSRWRTLRKMAREREEREDEADGMAQAEEEAKAKVEAEKFLAQQAEDMAAFEAQQRAAGVLISGEGSHAPLKLKVAATSLPTATNSGGAVSNTDAVHVGLLGNVEDESDLTGLRRGKLAHIDLHDTSTGNENREDRKRRVKQELPDDIEQLFERLPKWQHLDETLVETDYRLLLDKGIVDSIGESVPDMVDELINKVRAHATAKELVGFVEEVLEEEASPLIEKLWRALLIDTWSI